MERSSASRVILVEECRKITSLFVGYSWCTRGYNQRFEAKKDDWTIDALALEAVPTVGPSPPGSSKRPARQLMCSAIGAGRRQPMVVVSSP